MLTVSKLAATRPAALELLRKTEVFEGAAPPEVMTDHLQYIFLELPNCKNALQPDATVLENFCYALRNMETMTSRPAELKEEIFKLLFESAEITNFAPEEKSKYEKDMTTERDIRNYISYARDRKSVV